MLERLKRIGVGDNDGFFELKKKAKSIMVKVENIETGEIEKSFNCGTNERRAEKLEESLTKKTNLDKYHVYISFDV